jgi:hypothetical protein
MKTMLPLVKRASGALVSAALMLLAKAAYAAPDPSTPASAPASAPTSELTKGSLATMAPLGAGRIGMSVGGGVAVLLPFYAIEAGVGLTKRVDLYGRFESVSGILHYPSLGVRFSPTDIGAWTLGLGLALNYSFFGIATDQINLTSTFYMAGEVGISGPITKYTDLVFAVTGELDFFDYEVLDGEGGAKENVHYDATIIRLGARTKLTEDLAGYLRLRVRIPVETLIYEAMSFYVVPSIEVGGTFAF